MTKPFVNRVTALRRLWAAGSSRAWAAALLGMAFLAFGASAAVAGVGLKRIEVQTADGERFEVALFYPSDRAITTTAIGPYDVRAAIDALASAGRFPLILVSHGSLASMLSHHDMGSYFATSGFVVAAIEHTGDSYRDRSGLGRLSTAYRRARQVSAAIDSLLEGPYAATIDPDRIGIVGYSAGTATALMLAGATPDFDVLINYCAGMSDRPAICEGGGHRVRDAPDSAGSTDARVRAALLLAPIGAIFPRGQLDVSMPIGIVAAGADREVPYERNVRPLVEGLSDLPLLEIIPLAGHSVFLAPCSERLKALERELCTDPPLVDRGREHALLNSLAVSFFDHAFRRTQPLTLGSRER